MKYSIILPVRNGGTYVKECVSSILSQSINDFNLLILENASTDGTAEWLLTLEDPRIEIHAAPSPLTIEENWARIVQIRKNEFITLIGHDDILAPDYLQVMDDLISQHPGASLYQAHFHFIDSVGKTIGPCKPMKEKEAPAQFLQTFLENNIDLMGTGFMMRSADYDRAGGIPAYPNLLFADFELFMELTRLNYKATAATHCFFFRLHQSTTTISSDQRFLKAFDRFIQYLVRLRDLSPELASIMNEHGHHFLRVYCKGLAHRLLRTPKKLRGNLTVDSLIQQFNTYGQMIVPGSSFNPASAWSVRLAAILDRSSFGSALYRTLRKWHGKPVLK